MMLQGHVLSARQILNFPSGVLTTWLDDIVVVARVSHFKVRIVDGYFCLVSQKRKGVVLDSM